MDQLQKCIISKPSVRHFLTLILLFLTPIRTQCNNVPIKPVTGLAYGYYKESCPKAESIVSEAVQSFLAPNISQAGALVRLPYHDCFVQGCDASLLIVATDSELAATPNLSLRPQALSLIDQIKETLEESCPNTVSCADVIVLAGRDAVRQAGGPSFDVPTGRLDSLTYVDNVTTASILPRPTPTNFSTLLKAFTDNGLDAKDLVALTGAHTVGASHCAPFRNVLFPTPSSVLDPSFAQALLRVCPNNQSNAVTVEDVVTPNLFDNQYYINLVNKMVLFDSDRALLNNTNAADIVKSFTSSKKAFFQQFVKSYIKMTMVDVLVKGGNGNIRKVCSVLNPTTN